MIILDPKVHKEQIPEEEIRTDNKGIDAVFKSVIMKELDDEIHTNDLIDDENYLEYLD